MKQGLFREAIASWEQTTTLDPMNWMMFNNLGDAYSAVGRFGDAEKAKRRSADLLPALSPERFAQEQGWAWTYFFLTGSFEKLDDLLLRYAAVEDPNAWIAGLRFDVRMAERNYADAEKAISSSPVSIIEMFAGPRATKNFPLGLAALVQGDMARARALLESELQFARNELREAPESESRHAQLGLILAYLGQKEEAIAEGKRAVELMPLSKDAMDGPSFLVNLAEIYARVGEADKAIDLLEQLLTVPNGENVADLKFWRWDLLRDNPRFQKLATSPQPKIEY
jgi:tetratricopeptide (TPR) repeat protein